MTRINMKKEVTQANQYTDIDELHRLTEELIKATLGVIKSYKKHG